MSHLLPNHATEFEQDLSLATDIHARLEADGLANLRSFKFVNTPEDFLPFLIYEYGLGPITEFFDTLQDAIDAGVPWSRLRGTPKAVTDALEWIGLDAAEVEDDFRGRRFWTRYQIAMGSVPEALTDETPDLISAAYLADLSDAARSIFWRGYEGYDVRALQWGHNRWGQTMWGDDSGVRIDGCDVKWSHGISHEITHVLSLATRQALSIDVNDGDEWSWDNQPWEAPGRSWDEITDAAAFKAFVLTRIPMYLEFLGAGDHAGVSLGFRRVYGAVDDTPNQAAAPGQAFVKCQCRTDFGDGFGDDNELCLVGSVRLWLHSRPADLDKPGRLWVQAGELEIDPTYSTDDMKCDAEPIAFRFNQTVREHFSITIRAD